MTDLTVSAKWLHEAADELESTADDSLTVWVILGQSERYDQDYEKARVLRHAASIKNIGERREYLRNNGVKA